MHCLRGALRPPTVLALPHPPPSAPQARAKLEKYEGQDPSFSESRECKLVKDLLSHCEAFDTDGFTQVVFEYDQISKLDSWKTSMLLKTKVALKEGGDSLT